MRPGEILVQHRGYTTPCWMWQKCKTPSGYGQLRVGGRTLYAHRVYFEAFRGPILSDTELDHLCRNRACVNPDHLEAVPHHTNARRGSRTILTTEAVREIKRLLGCGVVQRIIAEMFDVSPGTVADISAGRTWKDGTL